MKDLSGMLVAVKLCVPRHFPYVEVEPIDTLAEINTSRPNTYMQEGLGAALGIPVYKSVTINSGTSYQYHAWAYRIRIAMMDYNRAFETEVIEIPYMVRAGNQRVQCILGMDILQYFFMTYDGPVSKLSLEYKGLENAG